MKEQQMLEKITTDIYTTTNCIEPFNDIWYLDCLMHGVAQIANQHNILPRLFENDYFEYKFDSGDYYPMLALQTKHFIPWVRIFEDNGINVTTQETHSNCMMAVKEAIERGAHVILPVDCYYEDIRPDTFQKKHLAHYLVIYGYDDSAKEFLLLEHNYENDLRYKHKRIKYSSATTAYLAYSSLLNQNKDFFSFSLKIPLLIHPLPHPKKIFPKESIDF